MNLTRRNKFLILVLFIITLVIVVIYNYTYKNHKQVISITPSFTGTSTELIQQLESNPIKWNKKVVVLNGKVTALEDNGLVMDEKIYCQFSNVPNIYKKNVTIKIKGFLIGYDSLLNEIKLNQCIVIKK